MSFGRRALIAFAIVIVAILVGARLKFGPSAWQSSPPTAAHAEPDGYPTMWAKGILLASVKAPKTASFDGITERRQNDDPTHWGVTGRVTSQNSFGALLTDDFWISIYQLCDRFDDEKCWKPDAVRIGDQMVMGSNDTLKAMKF